MKYRFMRFPDFLCKAVTLSYDDGNINDIGLIALLDKHGLKATFNLPGRAFGDGSDPNRISCEQARELYFQNGHDVALHGAQHMSPILSAPKDGIMEIVENRRHLESFFGRIIRGMAFPDRGLTNETIRTYCKLLGLTFVRCVTSSQNYALPTDWLEWNMTCYQLIPQVEELVRAFLERDISKQYVANKESMVFSMWGHSFELPGNRERLEDIFASLGGHEDVWYVNNTDLYDYCMAYNSLIFSQDNTMVYNPTQIPVWFEEGNGAKHKVLPGQTLQL